MDKVYNLEIDGQITLPDGSKLGPLYETPINIVQPSVGWPSDLPVPSAGGYGYSEILAGINTRDMSNDKVVNTKYLIVDFNDVDQSVITWLKQNCKADNVNKPGSNYRFHGIMYTTVWTYDFGQYDYKQTTALDESNYNYTIGVSNAKFYVILDRDYLSDGDKEQFPTNGIYFGITSAMAALKSVETGFIKTHKIDPSKYDQLNSYFLLAASDNINKVMKLIVKADGTISASEY